MDSQAEDGSTQGDETAERLAAKQKASAFRYIIWYYIPLSILFLGTAAYRWLAKGDVTGPLLFLGIAFIGAYLAWVTWQGACKSGARLRKLAYLREHPTDTSTFLEVLSADDRDPRVKRIAGLVRGAVIGLLLVAGGVCVYALFRASSGIALAAGYGVLLALVGACVLWVTIWGFVGRPRVADKGLVAGVVGTLLGIVYLVIANLKQGGVYPASLCAVPIAILAILGGILLTNEGRSRRRGAPDTESRPAPISKEQLEKTSAETSWIMRRSHTMNSVLGPIFTLIGIYFLLYRHDYIFGTMQLVLGASYVGQAIAGRRWQRELEQMEKIHRSKQA